MVLTDTAASLRWRAHPGQGPRVLAVNPWIHDFAAYNLWGSPTGLLACLHMLEAYGAATALVDLLQPAWPGRIWPGTRSDGTGRYPRARLKTPEVLAPVPRQFSRYGLDPGTARDLLRSLAPAPDAILLTCRMTYWYTGALESARLLHEVFPGVPLALGGTYPTLCPEHARDAFLRPGLAQALFSGPLETPENWTALWSLLGPPAPALPPDSGLALSPWHTPFPAFWPVLGARGCPFRCRYCASGLLSPGYRVARPELVARSLEQGWGQGARHFVFFDDALLTSAKAWLWPALESARDRGVRPVLHAPNAVHVSRLSRDTCRRLRDHGLHTLRLGLETLDFEAREDAKLTLEEWEQAVAHLREAGFGPDQLGAYVLFGLPGQDERSLRRTVLELGRLGIPAHLTPYSPIPRTPLFPEAVAVSRFPLEEEPLCHNPSLWPCRSGGFSWADRQALRTLVRSAGAAQPGH